MMLSPNLINDLIGRMQFALRDETHFKQLMDNLCNSVKDQHTDGSFDAFGFAWGALPDWAKTNLLAIAYRDNKNIFARIKPTTPIEFFTDEQRAVLSTSLEKLLTAIVTLYADYQFADDFYKSWLPARRDFINQTHLKDAA